jgi:hypothetical protein
LTKLNKRKDKKIAKDLIENVEEGKMSHQQAMDTIDVHFEQQDDDGREWVDSSP